MKARDSGGRRSRLGALPIVLILAHLRQEIQPGVSTEQGVCREAPAASSAPGKLWKDRLDAKALPPPRNAPQSLSPLSGSVKCQ